ncbi:unnamed protein product [Rhizophagus irregularis]|nr:unnamed protein product [Rhizophagus irregularis]
MQTYPDYVYRPNKRKNEKRRQARKNAVATFNSQDTTTTNNYEGGEAGPIQIPIYINPKLYWMFNVALLGFHRHLSNVQFAKRKMTLIHT